MFHKYEFKAWEIAAYAFAYAGCGRYATDALIVALNEQAKDNSDRPINLGRAIEDANIDADMTATEEGRHATLITSHQQWVAPDGIVYLGAHKLQVAIDPSMLILELAYAYDDEYGKATLYISCDHRANKTAFLESVRLAATFTAQKDFVYPESQVIA